VKFRALKNLCLISFILATLLVSCGGVTPVPLTPSKISPVSQRETSTPTATTDSKTGIIEPKNVYKLQIVDKWGKGNVYGVALSSDEKEIAVSTAAGIYIYNYATLQEQQFIDLPIIRSTKSERRYSPSKSIRLILMVITLHWAMKTS